MIDEESKKIIDVMDEVHGVGLKVFTPVEELFKSWEEDIEQKANEALNKLGEIIYPIDVLKIARAYDLEVFSDTNFPKDESGFIALTDNGKYEITLNEYHPVVRKRFTLAHEIAHFLFDKDYIEVHKSIDRDSNPRDEIYRMREKNCR